jgi:hypothetical protein
MSNPSFFRRRQLSCLISFLMIKSVLVKTGEFKESDLAGDVQPDFIVDSVNEIGVLF